MTFPFAFPIKQLSESLLFDIEKENGEAAFQGEVATDDRLRKIRIYIYNALLQ